MSTKAYRMDNRTEEQFAQDIKKGTERERLAISLFRHYLRRELGFTGDISENGVDMTGDFIADESKVSAGADYLVGENKLPLEVKTSANHTSTIYLKVRQIDSYIKQGASLLYVNGIDSFDGSIPAFTFFTLEDLKRLKRTAHMVHPMSKNGGKLSYELDVKTLEWFTFGGKVKKYGK